MPFQPPPHKEIQAPTAAMVVIGNEILSGKVVDKNSPLLAKLLRAVGVDLRMIVTVPDHMAEIGRWTAECAGRFDWVFTSGGVGPTHDDITYQAIAQGFGVPLAAHPRVIDILKAHYPDPLSQAHLQMAELPQGADVVELPGQRFPTVRFRNVYILPGVPELFQDRIQAIQKTLTGVPLVLKQVYLNVREVDIAQPLRRVDENHPAVVIGSYPQSESGKPRLKLTLEATQAAQVQAALDDLLAAFAAQGVQPVDVV
ncbi:MAG: molybdopterin-binding protein [Deltaproteobacteria bacterium]|nr:molybdopterin-binding protein [Deltaproteobacteria bacterium]